MSGIVERVVARQHGLFIYWLPVFFGAGIIAYFSVNFEPPVWVGIGGFVLLLALSVVTARGRDRSVWRTVLFCLVTALCIALAGFSLARHRTHAVATPMLDHQIRRTAVTGTIQAIEPLEEEKGMRLILGQLEIERLAKDKTPKLIRVRVRQAADLHPGDRVTMLAGLNPPPGPVAPGAFDFQFYAWFRQIGAFGFAFHEPEKVGPSQPERVSLAERLRQSIGERIGKTLNGAQGALATAMMTGEVSAVPEAAWDAMRNSGLAHMLALSGTHVGLIAGFVFFTLRGFLALFPRIALYWPVKKIAAVAAIVAASAFVWLIGPLLPILRALVMTNILLAGILIDRAAISMRLLMIASLVIMAWMPEALLGPSFQMSYAAVAALILFFESTKDWWIRQHRDGGIIRKAALYILAMGATTMAASMATAPFSLFHFQQFSVYGLLANLLAVPVMSFIVMPLVVVVFLAMPLGLEAWPLKLMGWALEKILEIAEQVAALPQATMHWAAWPATALCLMVLAAFCLTALRGWVRWSGAVLMAASVIVILCNRPPDILVAASGKLIAVRQEDGRLALSSLSGEKFSAENWMRLSGHEGEKAQRWPKEGAMNGLRCDEFGCRLQKDGHKVAFSFEEPGQAADCAWAETIVATIPIYAEPCAARRKIDYRDLKRDGAAAIWVDGGIKTVRDVRGDRPWAVSNGR